MRFFRGLVLAVVGIMATVSQGEAALTAKVDLGSQSMDVYVDGKLK